MDWERFKKLGAAQVGKNYCFGIEVQKNDSDPIAFDCSELVEWLYAQCGITVPDGAHNQYNASVPIDTPLIGDVGFFKRGAAPCHHVGIYWKDAFVLEARGEPFHKVILRPRDKWEAWKEFTGWRRFKCFMPEYGKGSF